LVASFNLGVFMGSPYRDKKVVGVFVRFRALQHKKHSSFDTASLSCIDILAAMGV
jgi:hypothetical protein